MAQWIEGPGPMKLNQPCAQRATHQQIFQCLQAYKNHVYAPKSNYHVVSVAEFSLPSGEYFYTVGVNVEVPHSNKLGLHGEQSSVLSGVALLGSGAKFSRVWIMAAPENAQPETGAPSAMPCGKCRQILCSLAEPGAEIWGVNLAGELAGPYLFEDGLLLHPFKESDLFGDETNVQQLATQLSQAINRSHPLYALLQTKADLSPQQVHQYLQNAQPHIFSQPMKTSQIDSCVLQCAQQGYALGVLVQDIAYLTTDAVLLAVGQAAALYGKQGLSFTAIHLHGDGLTTGALPLMDFELLIQFAAPSTPVYFHSNEDMQICTLMDCANFRKQNLLENHATEVAECGI